MKLKECAELLGIFVLIIAIFIGGGYAAVSLSPRWAPIIFIGIGVGGAIAVIFGNGIKHKIKEVRNCI